jgi:putative ABC transport system permease protein
MKPSGFSTAVVPLRDDVLGATTRTLWVLAAAISLLFVIAAANVTNLFVLHAETRRQELATRLALGATRARLARYIFAESFLLSVMAALMAAGLAFVALRMLVVLAPENIPRLGDVTLDWRSGAAAAIATFVAAVCFASVTMARFSRGTVGALRRGAYTTTTRSSRTRSALVVAQVAMSVVLACGAAECVAPSRRRSGLRSHGRRDGERHAATVAVPDRA